MEQVFWGCFSFGIIFTFVTVVLGDLLSAGLDGALDFLSLDFLNPTVFAVGVTVFGGAGIMLTRYTAFAGLFAALAALVIAGVIAYTVGRFYVKPIKKSENSTAYSMVGLSGRIGEVLTGIPVNGFGEVLVKVGAGNTNHVAASFDGNAIQAGTRIVVVEVKNGVLYVSRFENMTKGV
ncbi:MAG: protease [Paenibacillaceae bacterium]|jgi:membrane protein implicated in regulation of membrane protease activity|nr:protease [Paenibacillaceae bacterium]